MDLRGESTLFSRAEGWGPDRVQHTNVIRELSCLCAHLTEFENRMTDSFEQDSCSAKLTIWEKMFFNGSQGKTRSSSAEVNGIHKWGLRMVDLHSRAGGPDEGRHSSIEG